GSGQRDPGVPVRDQPAFAAHPVDPAGIRTGVDNLRLVEQIEHKALVGRAALDDDCGLGHRPAQSAQRLVPVAAVGDDLRDHRVEVGGDRVALTDPGVDADAWSGRQIEPRDPAGGGGEVAVGVLCVEPRLDRVPAFDGPLAGQLPAGGDVQLELDQVDAVGRLGDRGLDLEARV